MTGGVIVLASVSAGASLCALLVTFAVLREAWKDHAAIVKLGLVNGRRVATLEAVRTEAFRLVAVALLLAPAAITVIDPPVPVVPLTMGTIIGRATYVAAQIVIAIDAVLAMRARQSVAGYVRRAKGPSTLPETDEEADRAV